MMRRMAVIGAWLLLATAAGLAQTPPAPDWKALEDNWNAYYAEPNEEVAQKLIALLPDGAKVMDIKDGFTVLNSINDHLGVLEGEIYSGNPAAVKLGFRLFTIAYGGFEVNLNKIMGNLIAFNPRIFLEELGANRDLFPNLETLLGSFLRDTASDAVARDLEKKLRIKSLESVEEKSLKALRSECIKILKKL
ncbi:MAG TPA: hypothetical protein PK919_07535 [Candidatus Aminicenantes bacterium]|nr:hypothetical protein [Candidatus Aminicenantes bacterium]